MELTTGFLPTFTLYFSNDFLSVPWSVLLTCQELITAFNLINLCIECSTCNTSSLVSSCCCFLLLKLCFFILWFSKCLRGEKQRKQIYVWVFFFQFDLLLYENA